MSESSGRAGAPWALWGLVVASVLLPLLVFAGGGWLAWRGTVREANASLESALAVSEEQATRVFDTHVLLGGRVNDLLGDLDDDAVIARERELHDRLAAMIAGYSQVTAIVVTGRGRTRAGRDLTLSDGSSRQLQRSRVFHRPARRRRAVSRSAASSRQGDPLRTCSRSRSAAAARERLSAAPSWSACRRATSADSTAICSAATPTTPRCCCARTARRLPAIPSRRPPRAASATGWLADVIAHAPQSGLVRGPSSIDGIERVDRLSPADELSGLRHHRAALERGGRRLARHHGDASDLRRSGNAGPARAQPAGDAAVAATA